MVKLFNLFVPSGKRKLDAVETFVVEWTSCHWSLLSGLRNGKEEDQFFTTQEEAEIFKEALKDAVHILRDSNRKIN